MQRLILFALFLVHSPANADEEMCPLAKLEARNYTNRECLFYLGTAAYRAGEFEIAVAHWRVVSSIEPNGSDLDHLIFTSLSNLGHHTFYGIGVERDHLAAVGFWKRAAENGEISARSYLGYAYADPDFAEKNEVTALAWFKSILSVADHDSEFAATIERIIVDTQEQIAHLEEGMEEQDRVRANRLATELEGGK